MLSDEAKPLTRISQSIERVRYTLSSSAVRRALEDYMDDKHNVVLPANWNTETHGDGSVTIIADFIVE